MKQQAKILNHKGKGKIISLSAFVTFVSFVAKRIMFAKIHTFARIDFLD